MLWDMEAYMEEPYTCILSDCQQKATPVFAKRSQNL